MALCESALKGNIRVTFAKWRCTGRALIELDVIRMKHCSQFMASLAPSSVFLGTSYGQRKIGRWIQMLKNDALRLRHFERDDLFLVIGAIRSVRHETPISGRGEIGGSIADSCQPHLPIGHGALGPGRDGIGEHVEAQRAHGELRF
jgi:hypothetical protein